VAQETYVRRLVQMVLYQGECRAVRELLALSVRALSQLVAAALADAAFMPLDFLSMPHPATAHKKRRIDAEYKRYVCRP
jgi:hypothetical protein